MPEHRKKLSLGTMCMVLVALSLLLVLPTAALPMGENWTGKVIVALKDVPLKKTPPQGLFCKQGELLDQVKANERMTVLEYKKIRCAGFYSYDYLLVSRMEEGLPPGKKIGYVAVKDEGGNPLFRVEQ